MPFEPLISRAMWNMLDNLFFIMLTGVKFDGIVRSGNNERSIPLTL